MRDKSERDGKHERRRRWWRRCRRKRGCGIERGFTTAEMKLSVHGLPSTSLYPRISLPLRPPYFPLSFGSTCPFFYLYLAAHHLFTAPKTALKYFLIKPLTSCEYLYLCHLLRHEFFFFFFSHSFFYYILRPINTDLILPFPLLNNFCYFALRDSCLLFSFSFHTILLYFFLSSYFQNLFRSPFLTLMFQAMFDKF